MGNCCNQSCRERRLQWCCGLLGLALLVYVGAFGLHFAADYLGRAPVLDARENLALAAELRLSGLPKEPLYRAMLYPWCLSLFAGNPEQLPLLVTLGGCLAHLLSACLVGAIAQRLWRQRSAALLAAVLYGGYPVALYFAGQVLDITVAISLFLASVYCLLVAVGLGTEASRHVLRNGLFGLAGFLGGVTVLARPNFLPPVLLLPLLPVVCALCSGRRSSPNSGHGLGAFGAILLISGVLSAVLGAQGVLNYKQSGEWRLLPWQGAYNLYAANRDGANGKFYKQRVSFDQIPAGMNSTRMESEFLYQVAHGAEAELDISAMNSYWRAELLREIGADPLRWVTLMAKKVVYLANNWEQYNNLTYAYHKERFALLRCNPLGWGVLCLAAFAALVLGGKQLSKDVGLVLALLLAAYAAGLLMFFVSARFRLPLAPLLCVVAGGLGALRLPQLKQLSWRRYASLCAGLVAGGVLLYGNWCDARDQATYIQDELLLANAAARVGDDAAAFDFAEAVLMRDANRQEARRIQVTSLFNLWLVEDPGFAKQAYLQQLGTALSMLPEQNASSLFIAGVYQWQRNDIASALASWREAIQRFDQQAVSSAKALQAVGMGSFFRAQDAEVEQLKDVLNP